MEALVTKERRSLRLHLHGDLIAGLQILVTAADLAGERRL
jgi:hypothetical protein